MKRVLTNDFSWSKSRHEKFSDCRRAYYFHYYQSWGGWELDAPRAVRELYVLKKLSNRFTWGGSIVHAAIRGALMAIRHGRTLDRARVIERVHRVMQQDFVFSRAKSYWRERHRKEFGGLVEHEYREVVAPDEWKTNWENVQAALTWFFQSRWVGLARALQKEQWLEVDLMDFEKSVFTLQGVKVFAVPDFAYLDEAGDPVVVDWKTGRAREGYDDQVLAYALYLNSRYQLPLERMKASLVYLNDGAERTVALDPMAVEAFRARFTQSTQQMRALLLDSASNTPLPELHFPRTEDLSACARCVFRRPCDREKAVDALRVPPPPPATEAPSEPQP
ncbi:MAG: RecB family exonuclease [Myxococcota bacterium]